MMFFCFEFHWYWRSAANRERANDLKNLHTQPSSCSWHTGSIRAVGLATPSSGQQYVAIQSRSQRGRKPAPQVRPAAG
eukprot:scaffold312665_cov27-Tisochrysis_lutea.AAC.1